MPLRVNDHVIEKAAERLAEFPGSPTDLSRRENLRLLVRGLVAGLVAPSLVPVASAKSGMREEVIVVYFVGRGKFSDDMRLINLNMTMFDLDGNAIGQQHGVHESTSSLGDLFFIPPTPSGPFDQPPVPVAPVLEWTKGIWTFADGSSVYAVGPARSHIVPFNDGSLLFTVTTGQTITSGTGRFANAFGIKQATGSAFIPREAVGSFPHPGLEFDAHTIEAFRIFVPKSE